MALASPTYSCAPCRAAPCTDYHGSFCLNFTKCNHPLLADARNKGLTFCTDLIAYLLYYADIRSRQNICFTPNNSDLTELSGTGASTLLAALDTMSDKQLRRIKIGIKPTSSTTVIYYTLTDAFADGRYFFRFYQVETTRYLYYQFAYNKSTSPHTVSAYIYVGTYNGSATPTEQTIDTWTINKL